MMVLHLQKSTFPQTNTEPHAAHFEATVRSLSRFLFGAPCQLSEPLWGHILENEVAGCRLLNKRLG